MDVPSPERDMLFPIMAITASTIILSLGVAGLLVYSKKHKHRVENVWRELIA